MKKSSQQFGDVLELVSPQVPPSFLECKMPTSFPDNEIPIRLSDILIPTFLPDLFWAAGKSEDLKKPKEPKKEVIENEQVNFPAPPLFSRSMDQNESSGLTELISGLSRQQLKNFAAYTNAKQDFEFLPLVPQGDTECHNLMSPLAAQNLFVNSISVGEGPVDILSLPGANPYIGSLLSQKGRGKSRRLRSLTDLLSNFEILGESKRLSDLENHIKKSQEDLTDRWEKMAKMQPSRREKNRQAAVFYRERKKRYIRFLEEKSLIMTERLHLLECENVRLRSLLVQSNEGITTTLHGPFSQPRPSPISTMGLSFEVTTPTKVKKEIERNAISPLNNLYSSDLPVLDKILNKRGTCIVNGRRKSKRLRLK